MSSAAVSSTTTHMNGAGNGNDDFNASSSDIQLQKPSPTPTMNAENAKDASPASSPTSPTAVPSSPPTANARPIPPCSFWAKGTCRNGDNCRFSHAGPTVAFPNNNYHHQNNNGVVVSGPGNGNAHGHVNGNGIVGTGIGQPGVIAPAPYIINIPPGHPVFSIDVECVATGVQHSARSIAQIALVDEWCRPVLSVLIRQTAPVLSYITELTGLTKEMLDTHGLPLADALSLLRQHLPPSAILVGQNVLKDVQWLQLNEGADYFSLIDLSALFKVWNPQRGEYTNFSQDHCAKVWIGMGDRPHHNAVEDAAISMSLFNAYRMVQWDPPRLFALQMATLAAPRVPGFSSTHPEVDGCCMGNRKQCKCGAPWL